MKIYVVRHGKTLSNQKVIATEYSDDEPLLEEGVEQARKTRDEIPNIFTKIYSSDFLRCKQTAQILNEKLNLPITYDERLRERNFGSLAKKKLSDVDPALYPKDRNQQYDYRPYGGESVGQVKSRLLSFLSEVQTNHKDEEVLIVAHGGIVRLLHHLLYGKIPEKVHNASVHEFEIPDDLDLKNFLDDSTS